MKKLTLLLLIAISASNATDNKDSLKRNIHGKWDSLRDDGWFMAFSRDLTSAAYLSQVSHPNGTITYTTSLTASTYDFQGPRLVLSGDGPTLTFRLILLPDVLYLNSVPGESWQSFVRCPPAPCDLRRLPIPVEATKA